MRFYRWLLAVSGILVWTVSMLQLCMGAAAQLNRGEDMLPTVVTATVTFPVSLPECALTVEEEACYEGPFWEDGTGREVTDVAALVISNHSGHTVARGAVILRRPGQVYVFEVYALPPGEKALVMEKYGKPYTLGQTTACFGWSEAAVQESDCRLAIREPGMSELRLTNVSAGELYDIRIRYKTYDPGSGMYLGGVAYEATVAYLAPGGTASLTPYHYLKDHSRIVSVTAEEA